MWSVGVWSGREEWSGHRIFLVLPIATSGSDWGDKPCGGQTIHWLFCMLCTRHWFDEFTVE